MISNFAGSKLSRELVNGLNAKRDLTYNQQSRSGASKTKKNICLMNKSSSSKNDLDYCKTFVNWKWFVLDTGVIGPGALAVTHVLANPVPWTQNCNISVTNQ